MAECNYRFNKFKTFFEFPALKQCSILQHHYQTLKEKGPVERMNQRQKQSGKCGWWDREGSRKLEVGQGTVQGFGNIWEDMVKDG